MIILFVLAVVMVAAGQIQSPVINALDVFGWPLLLVTTAGLAARLSPSAEDPS